MKLKHLLVFYCILSMYSCKSQEANPCDFAESITIPYDECGYVEVPNSWANKNNGTTKIAYIVIKSKSENRKEDPVIFIQGGPGGNVLPSANLYANLNLDTDRDFILYDQRGIGYSDAICPDLSASFLDVMARDIAMDNEDEVLLETSSECVKLLKDKNFKTAFGTTESARDLEALRKHLGYKQLNLFGGSYGTRLSMKYMELYPNSVRSAILSGLFPPEIRLYDNLLSNLNRSLELLFNTCENDADCSAKYPSLRADFEAVCKSLDKAPKSVIIDENEVFVNKQDFLLLLQQLLYNRFTISQTPSFILAFKDDNSSAIIQSIQNFAARLGVVNVATYWSVSVPDEGSFNNRKKLKQDGKHNPLLSSGISLFSSDPEVLKHWPSNKGETTPMTAVKSDIPTLLVSGEWDPITPPSNGNKTAESLTNASHAIFPWDGHCPINACFFNMANSFLNSPKEKVDVSCTKNSDPIRFN
ncbi:alpha/beta fold hydrolase [Winogradskyella sp. 3972H.M.0a.05]|uniref:alpha/beta fold hydrolase n=1 Tax=Winogradskyella sp. 3972H.M.0a.05 TaxID=2950277 RepID=UPI00339A592B